MMTALSIAQESIVQKYCSRLPSEIQRLTGLLEAAQKNSSKTHRILNDLNGEFHRMAGTAFCMGYAFLGRELSDLHQMVDDELVQRGSLSQPTLRAVASKLESVARLRAHASPVNSSLLYNDGIHEPILKRSKKHLKSVRALFAKQRILFADDDLSVRMLMRDILTSLGVLNVATAANGEELLDLAKQFAPTIIITDWRMEPLNGLEILRNIRRGDTSMSDRIRVIFLSTKSTLSDVQEAVGEGANHFLAKPFSARNVERALLHVLPQTE